MIHQIQVTNKIQIIILKRYGKEKDLDNQQKVENSQETNSQVDFGVLNKQKTDIQNNSIKTSVDESDKPENEFNN